jgi:orotate phosphoribosyltransferase
VRARLRDLLVKHSYRYDPAAPFQLASGKRSTDYVDCKATTMRGDAADLVATVVAPELPGEVTALGGLTMGADPIAQATAVYCTRLGRPLDAFSVRKEAKKHGLRKWIEGCAAPGATVAVVDDVVTTGGSTIDAIDRCRQEGLRVAAVVVLVDREEENGLQKIKDKAGPSVPVRAIFTLSELRARANEHSGGSRAATG